MTNEKKQLVFKDLCGRLPYNVFVKAKRYSFPVELRYLTLDKLPDVKPYLRPMSSMTESEERDYNVMLMSAGHYRQITDFLNEHHFDYRGLIEKGLALEAPADMYNFE
jgi:hypothetical protein